MSSTSHKHRTLTKEEMKELLAACPEMQEYGEVYEIWEESDGYVVWVDQETSEGCASGRRNHGFVFDKPLLTVPDFKNSFQ